MFEKNLNQENFCLIRDNLLLKKAYFSIDTNCYSCNSKYHILENCPFLHYIPNKNILFAGNFFTENQPRNAVELKKERRKYFKFVNKIPKEFNTLNLQKLVFKQSNQNQDISYSITNSNLDFVSFIEKSDELKEISMEKEDKFNIGLVSNSKLMKISTISKSLSKKYSSLPTITDISPELKGKSFFELLNHNPQNNLNDDYQASTNSLQNNSHNIHFRNSLINNFPAL